MTRAADSHRDFGAGEYQPWARVVADAAPRAHIVQLYQDQDFLNRAVCRFAGAALANGGGIILVPTLTHWKGIRPRPAAGGVDADAAQARDESLSPYSSGGLRSARARRSRCAPRDGRPGRSPCP